MSVNFQYNTLGCCIAGPNHSSTKRLMFQVLFFFRYFLQNSLQKSFLFIILFFYKITKIKIKNFEYPKPIKRIKNIILETSHSCSTIRSSHRPSNPAWYIVDWRILRLLATLDESGIYCFGVVSNKLFFIGIVVIR